MKKVFVALALLTSPRAFAQLATPAVLHEVPPKTADVSQASLQRIDQLLQETTASGRAAGPAHSSRDGKVVYRKAFGYDDLAVKTPLRPDAIVRIASQTKAVTSVELIAFRFNKLVYKAADKYQASE